MAAALRHVLYDGIATHAVVSLTGGVFMAAFALPLEASNPMIGILATLIQIPAVCAISRVRNRRLIRLLTSMAARTPWLGIAALPPSSTRSSPLLSSSS
ncbi:MAG: hypothetical protein QMD46_05450 [Methanomicrobiales archaeon]|nr:hypothetical protein [Methanomicrobiales archaeon]